MNISLLKDTILKDRDFEVIYCRGEKIIINPKILLKTLISPLFRKGKMRTAYNIALLNYISPKVVISLIDNSGALGRLSKYYPAIFIDIQNGIRLQRDIDRSNLLDKYIPNFACFSKREVEFYKKAGVNVGEYFVVGSLRLDYYLSTRKDYKKVTKKKFDICLISQFRKNIHEGEHIRKSQFVQLHEYLAKYIEKYRVTLCVACVNSKDTEALQDEKNYYRRMFGKKVEFLFSESDEFSLSSYRAIDNSELAISCYSTLGYEAFSLDCKTLFAPMTHEFNDIYFSPKNSFFSIADKNIEYECFEKKVTNLLNMPLDDFRRKSIQQQNYCMENTKGVSTIEKLNDLILRSMKK